MTLRTCYHQSENRCSLYLQRKTNRQCGIEEASWQCSKKLKAAVTGANCLALAGCSRLHFTVGCSRLHFTNDTVSVGNSIQMSQNIKNMNGHGCIPETTREVVAICDGLQLRISGRNLHHEEGLHPATL